MIDTYISDYLLAEKDSNANSRRNEVMKDFWVCCVSREASILGRKEVLGGKAKFGIFGDGKEVPQVALARAFQKGDWRSGYYRDQTLMFALGLATVEEFFAQLYADTENDPWSGGRQMNSHFSTQLIDEQGEWLVQKSRYNISSDISSTGGQMPRAVGLALASKKYRETAALGSDSIFSDHGNEVCFATIGDASTSEGIFWESVNAAGVQKIPMLISVWDDGYGISVPNKYQTTKGHISTVLEGFRLNENGEGISIYTAKCWDYEGLCNLYQAATDLVRRTHVPALVHVEDCTQQLGHSTSGSHERYKSPERLAWERETDCNLVMANWMVQTGIATAEEIAGMQERAKKFVKESRDKAWRKVAEPINEELSQLKSYYKSLPVNQLRNSAKVLELSKEADAFYNPAYADLVRNAKRLLFALKGETGVDLTGFEDFVSRSRNLAHKRYHAHLYSSSKYSALNVPAVKPVVSATSPVKNGFEVLNNFFDIALSKYPNLFAFGEDVGKIGGVNQGFMGMQDKYGEDRVFDTGIREWSIMGQAIGMAMRGLRPIAEIQYLDYLIYGLQPLTDDLATLRYRSNNQQQAPAIIRTRGHRLEGIWHSGSPMGMILNSLRGIYVLVPRNFVQAAGMYNTMLQSDDPAIVIECLNGYRLKETMPDNIGEYTVPLGIPEVLNTGEHITLVTYGSCVRVAQEAASMLNEHGISVELIDVQTLLPFDLQHRIVESVRKTNRVVFLDEDYPGGGTAFMLQEVLEKQGGYQYLDSPPVTITSWPHRPPYGSDGDYFSKPNPEQVFEVIYGMAEEAGLV